ncbi:unnamed protein product, partial [Rotaria sp. Silwood2]
MGGSGNVDIFLNNGAGEFILPPNAIGSGIPVSVTTGDVNGDGLIDIIVAYNSSNDVGIFYGRLNTIPTFSPNVLLNAAGATPVSMTTADVNGD